MWETVVFREVPRLLGQCESGTLLARNWEENCAFEVPRVEGQSPGGTGQRRSCVCGHRLGPGSWPLCFKALDFRVLRILAFQHLCTRHKVEARALWTVEPPEPHMRPRQNLRPCGCRDNASQAGADGPGRQRCRFDRDFDDLAAAGTPCFL